MYQIMFNVAQIHWKAYTVTQVDIWALYPIEKLCFDYANRFICLLTPVLALL